MGIYQIRNLVNGKVFVGSTANLDNAFSSARFKLFAGAHPNKELENDWKKLGTGKFAFEVLEEIIPDDDPNFDYLAELERLEDLWLGKLEPYDDLGYNERKKSPEERLRIIAANRKL